jgi:hypothetical protein
MMNKQSKSYTSSTIIAYRVFIGKGRIKAGETHTLGLVPPQYLGNRGSLLNGLNPSASV